VKTKTVVTRLTRPMIERAVADLYLSGTGNKATRLVLVDDDTGDRDMGGWAEECMVDRLCKWLGVEG
jgi:hypothetical protein